MAPPYVCGRSLWKDSLASYRELGDEHFVARLEGYLGYLALMDGDLESAAMCFAESFEAFRALGDDWGVAESMERSSIPTSPQHEREWVKNAGATSRTTGDACPSTRRSTSRPAAEAPSTKGVDRERERSNGYTGTGTRISAK